MTVKAFAFCIYLNFLLLRKCPSFIHFGQHLLIRIKPNTNFILLLNSDDHWREENLGCSKVGGKIYLSKGNVLQVLKRASSSHQIKQGTGLKQQHAQRQFLSTTLASEHKVMCLEAELLSCKQPGCESENIRTVPVHQEYGLDCMWLVSTLETSRAEHKSKGNREISKWAVQPLRQRIWQRLKFQEKKSTFQVCVPRLYPSFIFFRKKGHGNIMF